MTIIQQINLFNPEYSSRKRFLSVRTIIFACLLTLGVNLSAWLWFAYMNNEIEQQYVKINQTQQTQIEKMKKAAADLIANSSEKQLQEKLHALESEVLQSQQQLDVIQKMLGGRTGYSQYMRALTKQGLTNVWLNGLRLSGGDDHVQVSIEASALYPALVPEYLKLLRRQALLNGNGGPSLQLGKVDASHARHIRFELVANAHGTQP